MKRKAHRLFQKKMLGTKGNAMVAWIQNNLCEGEVFAMKGVLGHHHFIKAQNRIHGRSPGAEFVCSIHNPDIPTRVRSLDLQYPI